MSVFRDAGHLLRFAGLFVIGTLTFVGIRGWLVPRSFGEYGHYRGAALTEIAAKPIHFAGHQDCETCHTDTAETKKQGMHAGVSCEACHGPLAQHADDPSSSEPAKLDTAVLCVRCHEASAARPRSFPQVVSDDHSNGVPCETCHEPHSPAIKAGGAE
ncbi:MAG: multiheme c-type cytochrome [Acidobacteriaceae bacterium]